ncbi:MAG: hypothetical protein EOO14_17080 [Chitinophagaceae bacterium]|nr:MAG: hypothetical protein EOO14_17080 [Chitinophagaceae bacterium]
MAELKKYTSFEALKLDEKPSTVYRHNDVVFSEFEAFLKKLQNEYSKKKKTKTHNGKQPR